MSKKINKFLYLYVVQGFYNWGDGWEDLCVSESYREAKGWLKDYRANERSAFYRIINRRELNPEYLSG